MHDPSHIEYFLGANAPSGFYSLYDQLLPTPQARCIYLLKGGPGCGKSTLMRQVAARMEELGETVEYILCSGDPDSLDAILLPRVGIALADATAPHVLEPACPGVVERYLDLGSCYDCAALAPMRHEILAAFSGYKEAYRRSYRCLDAAGELLEDIRATLLTPQLRQRLTQRARGILRRELKGRPGGTPGQVRQRFLSAVTHQGYLCLYDTALAQCPRVYELEDPYGLGHDLLLPLLTGAVDLGQDVVACPDPMAPGRLAHLLLPQSGLAFLTSNASAVFPDRPARRIRLGSTPDTQLLRLNRARLRFAKKVSASLMDEGVSSLARAKGLHDELEALYNPHVNFDRVHAMARQVTQEIRAMI